MTKSLLAFYKEEYCSTPISIEDLCYKYNIQLQELGDISDWEKVELPEILPPATPELSIQPQQLSSSLPIHTDIDSFKSKVIKECLARLKVAPSLEVKELKELTTIVDIVDKSLKSTKESQNINVLIQNIVNKYGDDV